MSEQGQIIDDFYRAPRRIIVTQLPNCPYHDSDSICMECYSVFKDGKRIDWRKIQK